MAEELCVSLVPLFNQLEIKRQRQLERLVHRRSVERGTIIASPQNSDQLIIVRQGHGRLYQLNVNGDEQVIRTLSAGDYVGETWLLGATNTDNYVEMTTNSDICILYRTDFIRIVQDQHDIALKLLAGQAATISNLREQTQLLGLPSIQERLTIYLNRLVVKQGQATVNLPLKLKDLSSYLGTTPETLSRKLAQLEKAGRIKRHLRQVTVLSNPDK